MEPYMGKNCQDLSYNYCLRIQPGIHLTWKAVDGYVLGCEEDCSEEKRQYPPEIRDNWVLKLICIIGVCAETMTEGD